MKCIACGREMVNIGTHFECPNLLCDYEEEITIKEMEILAMPQRQASYDTTLYTSSSVI